MTNQIIGTGLSGLVGTRIIELLQDRYAFEDLSFTTGVDITNYPQVLERFQKSEAKTVLHMAAKTDVDGCEDDKILGEEGGAWMVNVIGTENIATAAQKTGKKVVYISTDFVFDGSKDFYTEEDEPNPVNWYGNTKYEAEIKIQELLQDSLIVRIAYPYRSSFDLKMDFVRRILSKIKNKEQITALSDHIFTPTFIDDIALALDKLFEVNATGIYHVVGSSSMSAYDAAVHISQVFSLKADIKPVTREQFFKGRAFRPFKLALKNDKISGLGLKMKSFEEGLTEFKRQIT